jgi:hypothetical protein
MRWSVTGAIITGAGAYIGIGAGAYIGAGGYIGATPTGGYIGAAYPPPTRYPLS